jgi:hypothetical protein
MMHVTNVVLRLALFALAFLLIESGAQTALTAGLTFAGNMSSIELMTLLIWSAVYVLLGVVALFTAFKLSWLRASTVLCLAILGALISAWNIVAVTCPSIRVSQSSFLLLSCIAHPVGYAGIAAALLLAGSLWLRHQPK